MGKKSRTKGTIYELEIAKILKKFGFGGARRTAQHCGKSGDASDVVGLPGIHIECKHYKNIGFKYDWLNQAITDSKPDEMPIVVHRTDRNPNVVTLRLEDFIALYKKASNPDDEMEQEKEHLPDYAAGAIKASKTYVGNIFKQLMNDNFNDVLDKAEIITEDELKHNRTFEEEEEYER